MNRRSLLGAAAALSVLPALYPSGARGQSEPADARPALVAVAASVQRAMEEIAARFTRETGHRLAITYGASGNFVRQIQQGLQVELFLSADEAFVARLVEAGLARDAGVVYASGRLALFVPKDSPIALDPDLAGLKAAWATVHKLAIASPELAPYGKAAREVLQAVGLWESAQAKLVLGENIAQATQFVATGAAQAGLTALSLVNAPEVAAWGRYVALPDRLHAPLRQRMALLRPARAGAAALYAYLQTPVAQAVLQRHGFSTP